MANDIKPNLRLIKTGVHVRKLTTQKEIPGNQFFPAIPTSCELLPKLRFMRVEGSPMLCIRRPGGHDFKPISFTRDSANVVIAPTPVAETIDADHFQVQQDWPHEARFDLQGLNARSLRGIAELAENDSEFPPRTEQIVEDAFRVGYLDRNIGKRAVWEDVRVKCQAVGIKPPSYRAVALRIDCLFSREVLRIHPLTRDAFKEKPTGYPSD
ncbi:hypothetical protein [Pseudomonas sp. NA-150]|uniref:hypothetical protein n=1 Tax=Pseudomonas sp. NA-150 TaxID=3367525 RepID=UPI0037C5E811